MRGMGLGQIYCMVDGMRSSLGLFGLRSMCTAAERWVAWARRLEEAVGYDAPLLVGADDHPWPKH